MIVDSHCHLDYPNLYNQLDKVIERAEKNNVKSLLTICTTLESFEKIKLIIEKYKNVHGTFGIHPHEAHKNLEINTKYILDIKRKYNKIIGVGETGLDFYYNYSDKKSQIYSFTQHIKAASELNIPLIVHTRNAEKETYDILKSEIKNSKLKVLIHCFTGSTEFAKKLIKEDCYISLSGIITFKNSNDLVKTVSQIPIERLLVETDSPYLAPTPYRGKSNEPAYIINTIKKLSEIKNNSEENIILNTTNNFKKLFNIK
tara:strand:+ start:205 stop:978 length:774 start_codon:yes stop_codon:yes gene_type:complete